MTSGIEFSVRVEGSGIACGNIGPRNISAMLIEGIRVGPQQLIGIDEIPPQEALFLALKTLILTPKRIF